MLCINIAFGAIFHNKSFFQFSFSLVLVQLLHNFYGQNAIVTDVTCFI